MPHGQGRGAGNKSLCLRKRGKKEPKSPGVYGREHGDRDAREGGWGGNWEWRGPTGSQHTLLHGSLATALQGVRSSSSWPHGASTQ